MMGVPPHATPLGYLLWKSGARWFKDWYFPEGWMEGGEKLQGNKPLNEEYYRKRTRERALELTEFLTKPLEGLSDLERDCRRTALAILIEIQKETPSLVPEIDQFLNSQDIDASENSG